MSQKVVYILLLIMFLLVLILGARGTNGYEIVAVDGSTPNVDGFINPVEWSDATSVSFSNTEVFVKQDGTNLYVAFNVSNKPFQGDDVVCIYFDVDHDENTTLQPDEIAVAVYRNGTLLEANVTGGTWTIKSVSDWTSEVNSTSNMWQTEFNITYTKIKVAAGVERTIGATFACALYPEEGSPDWVCWPPNTYFNMTWNPSLWGDITSTGYDWIPEFPSLIILPLFMIVTLLVAIVHRKRFYPSLAPNL